MSQHNPAALAEGSVFLGRYQIVRCIRAGGMGAVYECVHLTTRKRRALKVMLPHVVAGAGMRERFDLEARVTADIESDHIVETFDAGVDEATGAPFLVMELLRGDDLDGIVASRGRLGPEETVLLLSQAALALDRTHAAGIVHRDLKPQNLFLTTRDDGSPRLKILDFGIAKVVADGSKTAQQTAAIGTPLYMAPEQATGDGTIGPPADLYALGHIAYTLLTGQAYWIEEQQGLTMYAFVSRMIAGAVEPASARAARRGRALPLAFDAWFARATARLPAQRFTRATTQIAELSAALGTAPPSLGPRSSVASPAPSSAPIPAITPPGSAQIVSSPTPAPWPASGQTPAPASAVPAGTAGTTGALSREPPPAPPASRAPWVALAVTAVLACAAGLFAVVRSSGGARDGAAPPPSATTVVTMGETARPVVTASSAPSAPVSAPSSAASAAAPPVTAAPAARPKAKDATRPAPAPDCDPPFVVDGAGRRHMKPQCL